MEERIKLANKVNLKGTVDMHVHPGPDLVPRCLDYEEMALKARDSGMKALLYKPIKAFPTTTKADAAMRLVPGIQVFGGLILDKSVGGLNVRAVETAIAEGAKMIWMPVMDSVHIRKAEEYQKMGYLKGEGISIWKNGEKNGEIKPEVAEILDIIAEHPEVIVSTGHLSPEEALKIAEEAKSRGIDKVIANHINSDALGFSFEQKKEMARKGAYLEFSAIQEMTWVKKAQDPDREVKVMEEVRPENCIISSDCGHAIAVEPVDCLRQWIKILMVRGIEQDAIDMMVRENPKRLLNIE